MALSKDILGAALFDARQLFNNRTYSDLIDEYGDEDGIRLAAAKADAEAIVQHIVNYATVPGTGLIAPPSGGAVTGIAAIV